jgi:hypothetical protein
MRRLIFIAGLCSLACASIAAGTTSGSSSSTHSSGGGASGSSHAASGVTGGGLTGVKSWSVGQGSIGGKAARITMITTTEPMSDKVKQRLYKHGWVQERDRESGITYYCAVREISPGKFRNCFGVTLSQPSPRAT